MPQVAISFEESTMNLRIACCGLMLLFQPGLGRPGDCLWTQGPPKTYRVISPATYEKVLDIVFQHDEAKRHYDAVLRFKPSNAPESEISIQRTPTKTEVVEYTSLSGNIYASLDNILRDGGKEDAVEMAKQIRVRRRALEVPSTQAGQWWSRLPGALAATIELLEQRRTGELRGGGTITIDGTNYSFSFDQVGGHVSVEMWDHEISRGEVTGEMELVRWMNTVRHDIERLK